MTPSELVLVLLILLISVLFIATRLRPDLIALFILIVLGLTGLATPEGTFSGFAGSAVITILAIFIISEGLHQSGVTLLIGRQLLRLSGGSQRRTMLVTILAAATLSLFMNNIAAAGVLLPAVIGISRQTSTPPSRLLMPMAYGTILGGMATLLTTANIIVSGSLREAGYAPFSLLDFLPVGIPIVLAGAATMVLLGQRLLTARYPAGVAARAVRLRAELAGLYGLNQSLCEVEVGTKSPLAGLTLRQGEWAARFGLSVVAVSRGGHVMVAPSRESVVQAGDTVLAQGQADHQALEDHGLKLLDEPAFPPEVTDEAVVLGEVIVSPHARMAGKSLSELHFREKYGLNVLALWRRGHPILTGLAMLPLEPGDALLLQGSAARMRFLRDERDFVLLEEDPEAVLRPRKAGLAAAIGLVTLVIAAFGWVPIAVITMTGAVAMLLTGCLTMDEAYRAVEWKAIFLIAGMWPLGDAIHTTGLAGRLADLLAGLAPATEPLAMAAILMLTAGLLNQMIGGQVAVPIILAPISIAAAAASGADPRGMAMAVALGSSLAFLTPVGHPVNTLVMGSGGYTIRDYLRLGGPLTLVVLLVSLLGLRLFWGM